MKLALFEFHAPARRLVQCAVVAALLSALACAAGLGSGYVPWLACAGAWTSGNFWNRLVIPARGEVERSWPISERDSLWIRVLAAWSFCWVPALASQVASNLLYVFGAVTAEHWQTMLGQAACLICVTPIFSAAFHTVESRRVACGAFIVLTGLAAMIAPAAAELGSIGRVFPPWPFDLAALSVAFGLVYFTTVGARWEETLFEEVLRVPPPPGPVRSASFTGLTGPLPAARKVSRWTALLFFYHSGGWAFAAWPSVLLMTSGLFLGQSSALWSLLAAQSLLNAYWGSSGHARCLVYLPISRNRLFAWTFVPIGLLLLCATGIEALRGNRHPAQVIYRHYRQASSSSGLIDRVDNAHRTLQASPLHWRATFDEAPLARMPGGELQPITSYPVISGLPLRLYNPFDVFQWDEPQAFAEHTSQLLQAQDRLPVTPEQVRLSDPDVRGVLASDSGCRKGTLQATCRWPWGWLAMKFAVFALCMWMLASIEPRVRDRGRWLFLWRIVLLTVCWGSALGLAWALDEVSNHAPDNSPVLFGIAVVVGELVRLLESHPLLVGGSGVLLLVGLYWNLLRRYRSAEL